MIRIFTIIMMISATANAGSIKDVEELVHDSILESLEDFDLENKLQIKITKGKDEIEKASAESFEITNIEINEDKKSYTAFLQINEIISEEIAGKYIELVQVPVINKKLRRNEVITEKDIAYIDLDQKKLSRGYITDELELIGKSPLRTLFKNRPVLPKQVSAPKIVERKQAVTMLFENSALTIQASGTALQDGGMGEIVRVRNVSSDVIINAEVIGENLVKVQSSQQLLASNY